jgi:NADPH:quinone reductase-like Zn-dependent oxidoreductase
MAPSVATQWVARDFGGLEVLRQVSVDLPPPRPGEVTLEVRAAGMSPADSKHFATGQDLSLLPLLQVPIGQTSSINDAPAAVAALMGRHPFGKLALVA